MRASFGSLLEAFWGRLEGFLGRRGAIGDRLGAVLGRFGRFGTVRNSLGTLDDRLGDPRTPSELAEGPQASRGEFTRRSSRRSTRAGGGVECRAVLQVLRYVYIDI